MANNIELNIALSIQEATKSIQSFSASATKSFDQVAKNSEKVQGSLDSISKSTSVLGQAFSVALGQLAVKAFSAATDAAGKLYSTFVTEGIKAFSEQEDAISQLNSALAAQGDLSKESQKALLDQASALQAVTKFGDEAIIGVQSLVANLTNLDVNGIQRVTKTTLDFATALGVDTNTAALTISKALEGNIGALQRYGIQVKKGANQTETFNNILGALEQRFGTAASDAVGTFSGSVQQLKNSFGDLQEETGSVIAQNPVVIAGIQQIAKIVDLLKTTFIENRQAITDFVGQGLVYLSRGVVFAVDGLFQLYKASVLIVSGFDIAGTAIDRLIGSFNKLTGIDNTSTEAAIKNAEIRQQKRFEELAAQEQIADRVKALADESIARLQENVGKEQEIANTKFQTEQEQAQIKAGIDAERRATEEAARQEALAKEIEELLAHNENLKAISANRYSQEIAANEAAIQTKNAQLQAGSNKQIAIERKLTELRRAEINDRLNQSQTFFGNLSTLTQTGNKDLFAIGKAAALAQATIATAQAVLNALAVPPYPVGLALAISAGIAGAVQIAKISSTNLATGITAVPKGFPNDSFPANLTSGERVVNVEQNKDLTSFIEDNRGSRGILIQIAEKLDAALVRPIVVEIDGRAVFTAVNDELQSGRVFA